ncbi:MAG: DUF4065 domain-containing protein [Proteobacteria bacterium]|nr:MAG: DUF4065 domain-containing protein [Pseudomonadota bacterium]
MIENKAKHSAKAIANYMLALSWDNAKDEDEPIATSDITQMKLHKLLFFVQGFSLALLGRPAFSEPIVAWAHGPVVNDIYSLFRTHGKDVIPAPTEEDVPDLPTEDEELAGVIDEVMDVYGQFSAWKLRDLTHAEGPWTHTAQNQEIKLEEMRQHFLTRVKASAG